MQNIKIWAGEIGGYKLLDSGNKKKLEEINGVKIVRNEPRAWWWPTLAKEEWDEKLFSKKGECLEEVIDIGIGRIRAKIKYKNTSKHIGIFPEQIEQWKWIGEKLKEGKIERRKDLGEEKEINVLNLFGYTGIASLVAAQAGAKVTHVDASKQSVDWARENQKLSGMEDAPIYGEHSRTIRWIVDDVVKFLKKEAKRPSFAEASAGEGRKYDAIIMDPPSYGKGPKGEVWKIEEQLPELLESVRQILSDNPLFIIFNMYSTELSSISVANLLSQITKDLGARLPVPEHSDGGQGSLISGELAIKHQNSDKLLPMSIFAIWCAK